MSAFYILVIHIIRLLKYANFHSSNSLVENWRLEARKFLKNTSLSAIPWTAHNWKSKQTDADTVWIVKLSLLANQSPFRNLVKSTEFGLFVDVMSTCQRSDECHLFGRSDNSFQSQLLHCQISFQYSHQWYAGSPWSLDRRRHP